MAQTGRVQVATAFYPNLLAHAFAVIGLSNSRADYCAGLPSLRERFQEAGAEVLAVGSEVGFAAPVAGGPLFTFIYQIPARVGPEAAGEIAGVFEACEEALEARDLAPLARKYPFAARDWQHFYPRPWLSFIFSGDPAPKRRLLRSIRNLVTALAEDHFAGWWPDWRAELSARASLVGSAVAPFSLVDHWEEHLGVACPSGGLKVLLSRPDKTSASSVGWSEIVVGESLSDERIARSVLHEVGVRMFDPPRAAEMTGRELDIKEYGLLLRCVEAAACAEKPAVAASACLPFPDGVDPFVRSMGLQELVEAWRKTPGRHPLERVVALFEATSGDTR